MSSKEKKDKKRVERDKIVKLLYLKRVGGEFDETEYDTNIFETVNDCWENIDEIDSIITVNLRNYTIDRLNFVDRAIIEYAIYEMKFKELPYEIAINEAIELTKVYSNLDDDAAKRFNNKLLDNIKNYLMSEE